MRTTPITRVVQLAAAERNSGSIAGREPFSRGPRRTWTWFAAHEQVAIRRRDVHVTAHVLLPLRGLKHRQRAGGAQGPDEQVGIGRPSVNDDEERGRQVSGKIGQKALYRLEAARRSANDHDVPFGGAALRFEGRQSSSPSDVLLRASYRRRVPGY